MKVLARHDRVRVFRTYWGLFVILRVGRTQRRCTRKLRLEPILPQWYCPFRRQKTIKSLTRTNFERHKREAFLAEWETTRRHSVWLFGERITVVMHALPCWMRLCWVGPVSAKFLAVGVVPASVRAEQGEPLKEPSPRASRKVLHPEGVLRCGIEQPSTRFPSGRILRDCGGADEHQVHGAVDVMRVLN